jgi:hypothetical protein
MDTCMVKVDIELHPTELASVARCLNATALADRVAAP